MALVTVTGPRPAEVIEKYGKCLELVPLDKHFHDISVGLYVKGPICTVWTYSNKPGVSDRIREIRDQMAVLGGMTPVEETANQVQFPCGQLHTRALRFLLSQAVGKAPDYSPPQGRLSINDTKSSFTINVESPPEADCESDCEYRVSLEGEGGNAAMRHRMVMAGFARYGEMVQIGDSGLSFPCGMKHDALMRVLLPYSRNISSVETMMAAEALRSQMTTNTLGFSQT